MGEIVTWVPMLDEAAIHAALREITDETTEAVVIITMSRTATGVRSFGHSPLAAIQAAEMASPASRITALERAVATLRAALNSVSGTAAYAAEMSLEQLSAPAERYPAEI